MNTGVVDLGNQDLYSPIFHVLGRPVPYPSILVYSGLRERTPISQGESPTMRLLVSTPLGPPECRKRWRNGSHDGSIITRTLRRLSTSERHNKLALLGGTHRGKVHEHARLQDTCCAHATCHAETEGRTQEVRHPLIAAV